MKSTASLLSVMLFGILRRKPMRKKIIIPILAIVIRASVHVAEAQQAGKVYRIGVLISAAFGVATEPFLDGFRQGLRELGYVEGKTSSLKSAGARRNAIDCPISPLS